MKTIKLAGMEVPAVVVGCRRINNLSVSEASAFVNTAVDLGANFFDLADLYGGCLSETVFGEALASNSGLRDKIFIQTKCGIRKAMNAFDLSKDYILSAVDKSLSRLKTEYLDVLLIHRMDALVEPEEVAEAFDILLSNGKVKAFGVSNATPYQIELLKRYLNQPIVINQMQFGLGHCSMISQGIYTNMCCDGAIDRDGGILDYCRLNDITIQTWSPLQFGAQEGVFIGHEKFPELNNVLNKLAEKYNVLPSTIAYAWILRHPAHMQPIAGTIKANRLKECVDAVNIILTRDEWYELFVAAGNALPCNPQPGQARL